MDDESPLDTVGATAVTVALCRARESRRPDGWFHDPFAEHVESVVARTREVAPRPRLDFWVALRTRFLDELLDDALTNGVRQVVALGAGLDARAFRLVFPAGSSFYDVDSAPVLRMKRDLLAGAALEATCDRREIVADVTSPQWLDVLRASGWRASEPTCWIAEGLLVYLDAAARDQLLETLAAASPPFSRLGTTVTSARRAAEVALFRSGVDDAPAAWLEKHGWRGECSPAAPVAERFGRPVSAHAEPASAYLVDARPLPTLAGEVRSAR